MDDKKNVVLPKAKGRLELVAQVAGSLAASFQKGGRPLTHDDIAKDCVEFAIKIIKHAEATLEAS